MTKISVLPKWCNLFQFSSSQKTFCPNSNHEYLPQMCFNTLAASTVFAAAYKQSKMWFSIATDEANSHI